MKKNKKNKTKQKQNVETKRAFTPKNIKLPSP